MLLNTVGIDNFLITTRLTSKQFYEWVVWIVQKNKVWACAEKPLLPDHARREEEKIKIILWKELYYYSNETHERKKKHLPRFTTLTISTEELIEKMKKEKDFFQEIVSEYKQFYTI